MNILKCVILSATKWSRKISTYALCATLFAFLACTDYVAEIDDQIRAPRVVEQTQLEMLQAQEDSLYEIIEAKLGGCVSTIADSVGKVGLTYYICKSNKWVEATALEYDTYQVVCSEDGIMFNGNINTTTKYVCDNDVFRPLNEVEIQADSACTSYNRNEYYILPKYNDKKNYSYYKCTENGWSFTTEKLNQGTVTNEIDGKTYKTTGIGSQMWMAEEFEKEMTWTEMMKLDDSFSQKTVNGVIKYPHQGICMQGWHIPTEEDYQSLDFFVKHALNVEYAGKVLRSVEDAGTDNLGFSGKANRCIWTASEYEDIPDPELVAFMVGFGERGSDWMIGAYGLDKTGSCYVRCVKNDEE